jgi:two-component system sensor histidine kinase VicK
MNDLFYKSQARDYFRVLTIPSNNIYTEKTEVLYGFEKIAEATRHFLLNINNKLSTCVEGTSLSVALQTYLRNMTDTKRRNVKVRFVTEVTKDNVLYCKQLMRVAELHHLDGIKANFAVSEGEYLNNSLLEGSAGTPQLIYSNVKTIVEQQQYLFNTLWEKGIPGEQKVKEIEEGIEHEFLEIITDREKAAEIVVDLAKSIKKEALLFLPVSKAMNRMDRIGLFDYLMATSKSNGALIKIICPLTGENLDIVKRICNEAPDITILDGNISTYSMFIVDSARLFSAEAKKPSAEEFSEAIDFPIYSNSKHTVEVFKSFFELLWKENTLIADLKVRDKMQDEFINIASHELKTPTQAILSFSELMLTYPERTEEFIWGIRKHANRLQRLSNDIVILTRIESQSLNLNKSRFDLNENLNELINSFRTQVSHGDAIPVSLDQPKKAEPIIVEADRERIHQVISNLLDNARKFTNEGAISVTLDKTEALDGKEEVIISIRDSGTGLTSEIVSQIFSKSTIKSFAGIGLGLIVSKAIIEAHGGKIWAENNVDTGKGATFHFSLPISNPDLA